MALGEVVVGVIVALLIFGAIGCFVVVVVVRSIVPVSLSVGVGGVFDSIVLLCGVGGSVMLGVAVLLYLIFRHGH
jgi:hypothetical protein